MADTSYLTNQTPFFPDQFNTYDMISPTLGFTIPHIDVGASMNLLMENDINLQNALYDPSTLEATDILHTHSTVPSPPPNATGIPSSGVEFARPKTRKEIMIDEINC
jgi:hypothetical protein